MPVFASQSGVVKGLNVLSAGLEVDVLQPHEQLNHNCASPPMASQTVDLENFLIFCNSFLQLIHEFKGFRIVNYVKIRYFVVNKFVFEILGILTIAKR